MTGNVDGKRWCKALYRLFTVAAFLSLLPTAGYAIDDHALLAQDTSHGSSQLIDPSAEKIGVTDSEVLLGSCLPLSGKLSERGQHINIGANCYFNYVNEQGGVNKRKIKLNVCDDAYDPEQAIECFNKCLKNKAFAGVFFAGSAPITKYVRMAETTKTPLMGFCTGTPVAYEFHPTVFVMRASYTDEVQKQVQELVGARHMKRIGVIYQNDAFGAAIRTALIDSLKKVGLQPAVEASYSRTASNAQSAFDKMAAAHPDAVVLAATSDALTSLVKRKDQEGLTCLFVACSVATDYLQDLGRGADGIVLTQVVPQIDEHLASVALYNKLRKKYYPTAEASVTGFESFLNAILVTEGLKRAGVDLTRSKFIHALEGMKDFDIGCGPKFKVNYSATNHNGLTSNSVYFTIVRNGDFAAMTEADWKKVTKK